VTVTNLNDLTVGLLRTVVPALWGSLVGMLVTFLTARGVDLPAEVLEYADGLSLLVTLAAIGGWYALMRKLEPHMPDLLRTLLIGAPVEPTYDTVADGTGRHRATNRA